MNQYELVTQQTILETKTAIRNSANNQWRAGVAALAVSVNDLPGRTKVAAVAAPTNN